MRGKVLSEYHELLRADASLNAPFFARLRDAMTARRLLYGERMLGVSLRPHFLTRAQYDTLARASEVLAGAFDKIGAALLSDPARMERVGLTDMERRLALINPGYSRTAVTTRLDAFVHGDDVKFVEFNAENPSSLTDQPGLNQVLFEVSALRQIAERYRLREFNPSASLLAALLATYREWGGNATPNIAIVDWADLPTENEFILLRNYFVSQGVPTIICSPDELEYEHGKLRREDFRIDLVYKRVIIHELLARSDDSHPLLRAYARGDVCLVNNFRCKLLHKKAAFELLTDEANASWFTTAEREMIRRTMPWTRQVAEKRTFYRDEQVDLLEHVRKRREQFILKPNDDYGGHGITLGHR
ncbi:MAG: glutathionylspermidine synthase family protein, partial [Rubrivivax sp.]|nr:glutathionylspermidine synthase family protein [Pyrinomonadaceae bacterium]